MLVRPTTQPRPPTMRRQPSTLLPFAALAGIAAPVLALGAGGLTATAAVAAESPYTVAEVTLPVLVDHPTAVAVNEHGDLLVEDDTPGRAFRVLADGTVETLTSSDSQMTIMAINNAGTVVGRVNGQIARWPVGSSTPALVGSRAATASDIATDGTVVGLASDSSNPGGVAVKQAPGGAVVDLTTPAPVTDVWTQAVAINDAGQIAGSAQSQGHQDFGSPQVRYCGEWSD